jgi:hypothetical protein
MDDLFSSISNLDKEPVFKSFVSEQYRQIAATYGCEIEIDEVRSLRQAYTRFRQIFGSFQSALPPDRKNPNQFKIAAALCFCLRRARPVRAIHFSRLDSLSDDEFEVTPDGAFQLPRGSAEELFFNFADEVLAFELGLRVAHYFEAQAYMADVANDSIPTLDLVRVLQSVQPRLDPGYQRDIYIVLRDHAVSPFVLIVLYEALFRKQT